MDEGLKDRVDKVFGSISSSSSWSLSGQVERREWRRGDRDDDQIPVFSSVDDWDIRSSIGLDSTLDNEEEEDAYDQMAQGMEKDKCLYMKDVINEPFDSRSVVDDARRLKQDFNIKSIMKRKSCRDDEVAKPAKRVRFHSTCKNAAPPPPPDVARVSENVPDYLLNPSKYTRYTFDDNSDAAAAADLELLEEEEESLKPLLPKSVLFIPRKKKGEEHVRPQAAAAGSSTFGIVAAAAGETSEEENDDDDVSTKAKQVRQYRSKMHQYDDDDEEEEEEE